MAQHFPQYQVSPEDQLKAAPLTEAEQATKARIHEFAELMRTKLSEDGYRYDGPMKDVAENILKEARTFFPKEELAQLERPTIDQDILAAAKALNEMSELLIPPKPSELKETSRKAWSVLSTARSMNTDIADDLYEHWYSELDEDILEHWSKDVYSPEQIRDDIQSHVDESIFDWDRGDLINMELMKASTDLARTMLKQLDRNNVNEFSSKNPPTYEDGVKAAKTFLRFKQNHELKQQGPGLGMA